MSNLIHIRHVLEVFILSILIGFPTSVQSDEGENERVIPKPQVRLGGFHFGDSGDFIHTYGNLWGKFHFTPSKFVEATSSRHWITQENDQVNGSGLQFLFGDSFGKRIEGRMGIGVEDYEGIGTNLSYLASLGFPPSGKSYLTLKYEFGNIVYKVNRLDVLKEDISSHEFTPTLYHGISERVSFWGRFSVARFSDHNLRGSLDGTVSYMMKHDPSLSFTYALYYLAYKERSDLYWDPQGYLGHILLIRAKEDIANLLSVSLRGSIGFSPTEKKRTNPGFSVRLSLPDSPRWGLDVAGEYIGDGRRDEYYSYTTTSIKLFYLP